MDDLIDSGIGGSAATETKPSQRRRRRSWYAQRLRRRRLLAALLGLAIVAGTGWHNLAHHFDLGRDSAWASVRHATHGPNSSPHPRQTHRDIHKDLSLSAASAVRPRLVGGKSEVYPYSVVPGGAKDADELRRAFQMDAVVRSHYFHFDFEHARLIRAAEGREVYLSYRIRNTVFWTRKKVRLHPGELLLTDGKITARVRCGNQISEIAMPEVSAEEPDSDVFDQPVVAVDVAAALPIHPVLAPPDLPAGSPIAPQLFANSFQFPYAPINTPILGKACAADDRRVDGRCVPKKKPVAPEPPTPLLLASGLILIVWCHRKAGLLGGAHLPAGSPFRPVSRAPSRSSATTSDCRLS